MKQNKPEKEVKRPWPVLSIGLTLMAIVIFFSEERSAEKRRLPDPVQTEAALIKTYCGVTWSGKSRVPYLHLDYQYTTGSGKYLANTGIYLRNKNECEKTTAFANAEMSKKVLWYERYDHVKHTFSLEKPNTTTNAKICLVLALMTWLFGIFWRWAWSEEYQHFKGDVNTFR
jgi:hypothetical protein